MTDPISAVAHVAATVEEAKLCVATLRAHGIPAFVDGQTTQDEFAVSQRLMNLSAVRVLVPSSSLEQARQLLESTHEAVDLTELERQALAAKDDPDAESES